MLVWGDCRNSFWGRITLRIRSFERCHRKYYDGKLSTTWHWLFRYQNWPGMHRQKCPAIKPILSRVRDARWSYSNSFWWKWWDDWPNTNGCTNTLCKVNGSNLSIWRINTGLLIRIQCWIFTWKQSLCITIISLSLILLITTLRWEIVSRIFERRISISYLWWRNKKGWSLVTYLQYVLISNLPSSRNGWNKVANFSHLSKSLKDRQWSSKSCLQPKPSWWINVWSITICNGRYDARDRPCY